MFTKIFYSLFFVIIICLFQNCRGDSSKSKLSARIRVCDKLFVETYTIIGGGAGGGDRISEYLTDAENFRLYIDTYIQGDYIYSYECNGDSIKVFKIIQTPGDAANIIKDEKIYFASKLKREKKLE